jgi:tartrate dehydrogenase/decarboxylase / D-malate dehydrogenase
MTEARGYAIASIPGDGIGPEVCDQARLVLDAAAARFGFGLAWTTFDWSCARYAELGEMMPEDGLRQLEKHDAIFLGAVGDPSTPDHVSLWGLLIPIRRHFNQYVNLRPAKLLPGVSSPLRAASPQELDFLVVRENTEGEYSQRGGRHDVGTPTEHATQEAVFTRAGIERIARFAFTEARSRTGRVASATKSNGIVHTMPFWDEVVDEVAADYPDVQLMRYHIDALAARMVANPGSLDVILASNLFGDILSDLAAALVGGLGLAASANLNPERTGPSMFESIHGSAPDIVGLGIANPVAQVLAGAMMLRHLGEVEAADAVEAAVSTVLGAKSTATPDLGGTATTSDMGVALTKALAG